mgnify:CR=1 FL=1
MKFSFLLFYFCLVVCIVGVRFLYRLIILKSMKTNKIDSQFQENTWFNNYMLGLLRFRKNKQKTFMEYIEGFKERQNKWEETTPWYLAHKIRGIVEINTRSSLKQVFRSFQSTTPPYIQNHLLPYKIIMLTKSKKVVLLLNHFYCDGIVLHDVVVHNLLNTEKTIQFMKYKYIPLVSDALILNYGIKSVFKHMLHPHKCLPLDPTQSTIIRKTIHISEKINRWFVLSRIIDLLYRYLNPSIKQLNIAITVGFDDTTTFCNNRIGVIIITIPRMNSVEEYENTLKKEVMKHKKDALISYDLVRNFPIHSIRKNFDNKIDVVLTMFQIQGNDKDTCDLQYVSYDLGSFIGIGRIPIYVLSMTLSHDNKINICIKTTTPAIDTLSMIKKEKNIKKIYKWNLKDEPRIS